MITTQVKYMELSPRLVQIMKVAGQVELQIGSIQALDKAPTHDLFDFMFEQANGMFQEYIRIQKKASEDPGTAGDQGEENWASLFKRWLPPSFTVVTKGRILSHEGIASPQIDILILHPSYPDYLKDKKLYLAGGVVAAFECKTTLRAEHIKKAILNSTLIKKHALNQQGTPYRDLHSSIIYGLLAHSHVWKNPTKKVHLKIYEILYEENLKQVKHPREELDLICISNLGFWNSVKGIITRQSMGKDFDQSKISELFDQEGICYSGFLSYNQDDYNQISGFQPIGAMLAQLFVKIAWQNPEARRIANYIISTHLSGSGKGVMRLWPLKPLSTKVREGVLMGFGARQVSPLDWNEWSNQFDY
ncbi:MAG: DUF6602 domain-containing protein [Bacteroidales bacterium]